MPGFFTESNYENAVLELLSDNLGYSYIYAPQLERDYKSPLYDDILQSCLARINPRLPEEAITEAIYKLKNFETGSLLQKNIVFTDYLQNGIQVKYYEKGEERADIVRLIDFNNVDNNEFIVANQWTIIEHSEKRPDIIIFVNGLPLVVIELKSPSREETDASAAYRQLRNYIQEIPSLFVFNQICIMSDMTTSKAGTITSGEDRFMEWKTKDGSYENTPFAGFDVFFEGIFEKKRFLDILKHFICFNIDGEDTFKILAGYHQYFAVKKAINSTLRALGGDGKGGVFWHTQGSGKSLSMVFYSNCISQLIENATILVITDRNDLDDQLFGQFSRCKDFLRQVPVQVESRKDLKAKLLNRAANGIFFTTMQKFEESSEALSDRDNIIVIADEAHRSQYGLSEKIVMKKQKDGSMTATTRVGIARIIRDSFPNATYIGFTGTPIAEGDRNTREVFGDYIDVYDMTQAVEDGATRPVYYENRGISLHLDKEVLAKIDEEYSRYENETETDPYIIEKSKKLLSKMEAILGADDTVESLVNDILSHYENYRANLLTGKAMIVAYSRPIAIKIYKKIIEKRGDSWKDKVALVMTQGNNDPEDWAKLIGNKAHKDELARKFKDNKDSLKIAIVVDMWLTGFDVPSLATMYVYKPMAGHNLMQAIARVNRVFGDKEGGLVVDYVGIANALKQAMNAYTGRDKKNYGDPNIDKVAYPKFLEKLEVCRDFLYGFDYKPFFTGSDLVKGQIISGATNFLFGKTHAEVNKKPTEKTNSLYMKEALLLKQALSLCSSLVKEELRHEAAFFEAVRIMVVRLSSSGGGTKASFKEINDKINELLKQSIKAGEVITVIGEDKEAQLSLFDPKFLKSIASMKHKNLAVEMLKKLIEEQVSLYRRTNVVKSEKFSEIIQSTMNRYINGLINNEEVIRELMDLAKDIAAASEEGKKLGLTAEEMAFYDALTKPRAIKDFYKDEELVGLTKELTEILRKNRTIDWQQKESARAGMRRLVKHLLKKYKYPPEDQKDALETVMTQCELWVDTPETVAFTE